MIIDTVYLIPLKRAFSTRERFNARTHGRHGTGERCSKNRPNHADLGYPAIRLYVLCATFIRYAFPKVSFLFPRSSSTTSAFISTSSRLLHTADHARSSQLFFSIQNPPKLGLGLCQSRNSPDYFSGFANFRWLNPREKVVILHFRDHVVTSKY